MANYGLLGSLAEHLQGQMRCQKICSDSQVKIFLLVGMCRPQPQHQGPKGVGHPPCASWRPWGALTGANEVSKDLFGLPDEEFFIGWHVPPTIPAPGTKRSWPCASWKTWEAPTGANEVSKDLLGLTDEEFFIGWYVRPTAPARGTKMCRPCASWRTWGALAQANEVSKDLLGLPGEDFLLAGMCHPQPRHQKPQGADHVPTGGMERTYNLPGTHLNNLPGIKGMICMVIYPKLSEQSARSNLHNVPVRI